jgi:hypothetical protein
LIWGFVPVVSVITSDANNFQDPGQLVMHLLICEPQHTIAPRFQPFGPYFVILDLCSVRLPIDLDDQPVFHAAEIDDEATDRVLTPKSQAIQLLAT